MFEKIKPFMSGKKQKFEKTVAPLLATGAAIGLTPVVFAGDAATGNLDLTMGKIIGVVFSIFRYIGIILALWGTGALVMAFKNEDADSKSRAIMSLVVGVILIFLKTVASPILEAAGIPNA